MRSFDAVMASLPDLTGREDAATTVRRLSEAALADAGSASL
jgi:hypothetical protein